MYSRCKQQMLWRVFWWAFIAMQYVPKFWLLAYIICIYHFLTIVSKSFFVLSWCVFVLISCLVSLSVNKKEMCIVKYHTMTLIYAIISITCLTPRFANVMVCFCLLFLSDATDKQNALKRSCIYNTDMLF